MKLHGFVTLLLLVVVVPPASAASDPMRGCLNGLKTTIEAIGASSAGEVNSERVELESILSGLERRAQAIAWDRSRVDSDQKGLDFLNRERDRRLAQIELDQKSLDDDFADYRRRLAPHQEDALQQHLAAGAATTDEQLASANSWGEVVQARKQEFDREYARLSDRKMDLEVRRAELARLIVDHLGRFKRLQRFRSQVDRETAQLLSECSAASSRALAVKQIVDSPSRVIEYQSPSALADKAAGDFFKALAKEAGLKTVQTLLVKLGLKSLPVGLAVTAADTFADIAIAGVDQRTREVTKNLFLIGDYGVVMKRMIQAQGAAATKEPEYLAMSAELERLSEEMPANEAELVMQGLRSTAALGTAFVAVAGHYVSKPVERYAGTIIDRLDDIELQHLSPSGVEFFRESFKSLGKVWADETTKNAAREGAEAVGRVNEERSKR